MAYTGAISTPTYPNYTHIYPPSNQLDNVTPTKGPISSAHHPTFPSKGKPRKGEFDLLTLPWPSGRSVMGERGDTQNTKMRSNVESF